MKRDDSSSQKTSNLESPVPDPDLEIRWGGGHPDPWIKGWGGGVPVSRYNFFRASFWSKNKGGPGPPGPLPGSATGWG